MSGKRAKLLFSLMTVLVLCLFTAPCSYAEYGECNTAFFIRTGNGTVSEWNDDSCHPYANAVNIDLAGIYIYAPDGYYVYAAELNGQDILKYAQASATTTEIVVPALTFSYYDAPLYHPIHLIPGEEQNLDITLAPIVPDADLCITYTAGASDLPSSLRDEHSFVAENGVHIVKGIGSEFAAETPAGWLPGTMRLYYPNGSSIEVYSGQRITPYQSCTIQVVYVLPVTVKVNDFLSAEYGEALPGGADVYSFELPYGTDETGISVSADVIYEGSGIGWHRAMLTDVKVTRNDVELGPTELRLTTVDGGITVYPAELNICSDSLEKVYDGSPLQGSGFTADNLKNGDEIVSVVFPNSITNVGSTDNAIYGAVIMNGDSYVTDNYSINYVSGSLTVTPASLKITAKDCIQEYNGQPQSSAEYRIEGQVAEGDTVSVQSSGCATYVSDGKVDSVPSSAVIYNPYGQDVTYCYDLKLDTETHGSITITPRPVTVIANSFNAVYTGSVISSEGCGAHVSDETPLAYPDDLAYAVTEGERLYLGDTSINVSDAHIFCGEADVTENYSVTYLPGTLSVIPDEAKGTVSISLGGSKVYDGTDITAAFDWFADELASQTIGTISISGSTLGPSASSKEIKADNAEITITGKDGQILSNCDYNLEVKDGCIVIVKQDLRIRPRDAVKTYDGQPYIGVISLEGALSSGKKVYVTASTYAYQGNAQVIGSAVGKYTLKIDPESIVLTDEEGNDIAANFNIFCEEASLEVITKISSANYSISNGGSVMINCAVPVSELVSVSLDGVTLIKGSEYTVSNGNATIITFVNSFLKNLAVGNHTLTINYETAGSVSTVITVSQNGRTSSSALK